jgi:preprotein translocase subunit YajC
MMDALTWASPLLGATSKSTSSSSSIYLIFIVIGAAFYFLIYRPQQRKAKALREQSSAYDVGDEVLTAGGIVGHIIDIDGDRVTLETSVGASFVVLKPYVLRKLEEPVPSGIDEHDGYDAEHDEHDEHDGDDDAEHDGHAEDADESTDHDSDPAPDSNGPRPGAASSSGDPTADDHPAGRGGGSGNVTKRESGDESTGSDGPSII